MYMQRHCHVFIFTYCNTFHFGTMLFFLIKIEKNLVLLIFSVQGAPYSYFQFTLTHLHLYYSHFSTEPFLWSKVDYRNFMYKKQLKTANYQCHMIFSVCISEWDTSGRWDNNDSMTTFPLFQKCKNINVYLFNNK